MRPGKPSKWACKTSPGKRYHSEKQLQLNPSHSLLTDHLLLNEGYRYAYALTNCVQDAEDLIHDGWLKLYRRYGRVESRRLLFVTVRNLFIDRYRRIRLIRFESLDLVEPPDMSRFNAEEPGLKADLEELLALLRPMEREMLFLHYYQGYTAEEISVTTGRPRGTVLSIIHRAVGKLRVAFTDPSPDPSKLVGQS
jgi:RNA polymerase sigma-70 factor (ECF subfamily)